GVLAADPQDESLVSDRDLEVPVRDAAAERLDACVAAVPEARDDRFGLHAAMLCGTCSGDEALPHRLGDGVRAAPRRELRLEIADDRLDRALRVGELGRDRLRRLAGRKQAQDLEPALVQTARGSLGVLLAPAPADGGRTARSDA